MGKGNETESEEIRIEYIPLSEAVLWDRNPKQHDIGKLMQSIERYGFIDPPKYDASLDAIVYGNGRTIALAEMKRSGKATPRGVVARGDGEWLIPVKFGVDQPTKAQAEALGVDHNNLTMSGGDYTGLDMARMWEQDTYAALLAELAKDGQVPLSVDEDIDALLKALNGESGERAEDTPEVAPDRFEEVAAKWGTADGQLWECGDHLILCGDSLDHENVTRLLGNEVPALILADPPYGVNIVATNVSVGGGEAYNIPFGGRKNAKGFRGSVGAAHVVDVGKYPVIIGDESTDTAERAVTLYCKLFPDSIQVWWGANYYSPVLPASQCWLVWDKDTTGYFADCELAWTNMDKAARLFHHRWNGMLRDSERERRWHPTQKPAVLAAWVYGEFTDERAVILDPFCGAGWSVLGGEQSGRKVRAIEKSHEYIAVILERWHTMTGKTPRLVEG